MGKNPNAAIYYIKTLNSPQRTVAREVAIDGHGGFISEPAKVILVPWKPDTGIVFEVSGDHNRVPANPKFLIPRSDAPFKTTSLRYCDARILTVEHLLAALYGLGITNLHVIVEPNGCIPFSDGSSEVFARELLKAGLREQQGAKKRAIYLRKADSITLEGEDGNILLEPIKSEKMMISAHISYPNPIGIQHFEYVHDENFFCLELARARTFQFKYFKDLETTREKFPGFMLDTWRYINSNSIIYTEQTFITHLRWANECVRHKVLDFLGDIKLLGFPLFASINLYKTGHAYNHALINKIWDQFDGALNV